MLPFIPKAQRRESPLSILRRASIGNFQASTMGFACSLHEGFTHSSSMPGAMARSPELCSKLFRSLGLSASEIEQIRYARTGQAREDDVIWNGLKVPIGDLQFKRSKICVPCYLENGVTLSDWDHIAALGCSKHNVSLVDACPCCGTTWSYQSEPLSCGCPVNEVLKALEPCSSAAANLVSNAIEGVNQEKILILGEVVRTLELWLHTLQTTFDTPASEIVSTLAECRWPLEPTLRGFHPRVLLARFLVSKHSCVREHGVKLLKIPHSSPEFIIEIGDLDWPKSTAEKVLGVGRLALQRLLEGGHLENGLRKGVRINSINSLLYSLCKGNPPSASAVSLKDLRATKHRVSLSHILKEIQSGEIVQFEFEPTEGLSSLRCDRDAKKLKPLPTQITARNLAERMGTNYESIRKLIKLGLIQGQKGTARSSVEWTIHTQEAESFRAAYVFASEITAALGLAKNTVARRLQQLGIKPVSGPGIDAGITYVFRREEVDIETCKRQIATIANQPSWRKPKHPKQPTQKTVGSIQIADQLGLSKRYIREIVVQGWISPIFNSSRRWAFSSTDIDALATKIEDHFIEFQLAAKTLGQTRSEFQKTWIDTGALNVRRFGPHKLIALAEFKEAEKVWQIQGTSSSIGRDLGRTRWLAINLEKIKLLGRESQLGSGNKKVNLYTRDVDAFEKYDMG